MTHTTTDLAVLQRIADAKKAEDAAATTARAEAEALFKARTADAREATNRALAEAVFVHGIRKTDAVRFGLNQKDRHVIYRRFAELSDETINRYQQQGKAALAAPGGVSVGTMVVERHEEGLSLHFDGFTHADLTSEPIWGSMHVTADGELVSQAFEPDKDGEPVTFGALVVSRFFSTTFVQERVA